VRGEDTGTATVLTVKPARVDFFHDESEIFRTAWA
jgi:hypothetical protein